MQYCSFFWKLKPGLRGEGRGVTPSQPSNFRGSVYMRKKVDSVARANRACASSDCLKQHSRKLWLSRFDPARLTGLGKSSVLMEKIPPPPRPHYHNKNDDPARKLTLLVKQTFYFSVKQFATFCKEMYEKLARPRCSLGRRAILLPRDNCFPYKREA